MKYLTLFALLLTLNMAKTQAQDKAKIKESAQSCANAFIHGDYAKMANFTYPRLLTSMGGREKFIAAIKGQLSQMSAQGITFSKVVIGEPGEIYRAGTELHCLVPQTLTVKASGGYVTSTSSLLAVSPDKGKTWFFIDTSNSSPARLKQMFPNFNSKLVIPAPTKPVFRTDSV